MGSNSNYEDHAISTLRTASAKENQFDNTLINQPKFCRFDLSESITKNASIFIAEYSSLRVEIHQRLAQQTTLSQIAITIWGLIIGYAFTRIEDVYSYNDVYIILAYPLLALFISHGWAFNNFRICQIGGYLRSREIQISKDLDCIGWENYVHDFDKNNKRGSNDKKLNAFEKAIVLIPSIWGENKKVKHGIAILAGTQFLCLIVASILIGHHLSQGNFNSKTQITINHTKNTRDTTETISIDNYPITTNNQHPSIDSHDPSHTYGAIIFLTIDTLVIILTIYVLRKSTPDQ
jgi:hypothetical protein